jgi:hypothetical protein
MVLEFLRFMMSSDHNRTPHALKDVWVEEDRVREGTIQTQLFDKIREDGGVAALKKAK